MTAIRVGLMGYGRAGQAVAGVLAQDPRFDLRWIATRTAHPEASGPGGAVLRVRPEGDAGGWLDEQPVDAVVDFSSAEAVAGYGPALCARRLMLVSAISAYSPAQLAELRAYGRETRVLASPNITLGINFLILAARLLRDIAPFADVEILEQHFREKPEVSGTARKIAETLNLEGGCITSLRLGGIVGHHEVIFGFPHQTVRLVHESIRREAFGTGAAFALGELADCDAGFYTFDDLLMRRLRAQWGAAA